MARTRPKDGGLPPMRKTSVASRGQTNVRFSGQERARYEARAMAAGTTFSEWLRNAAQRQAEAEERVEREEAMLRLPDEIQKVFYGPGHGHG